MQNKSYKINIIEVQKTLHVDMPSYCSPGDIVFVIYIGSTEIALYPYNK